MWKRIFPDTFDNRYRGQKFALWLLYPLTFLNLAIALGGIFAKDGGAQSADGIPLDTFGNGGAEAVIRVVAILGLYSLLLCVFYVLALVRYRSMIPLIYVLLVVDYLGRRGIAWMKPYAHIASTSAGYFNLGLFVLSLAGLVLSLVGNETGEPDLLAGTGEIRLRPYFWKRDFRKRTICRWGPGQRGQGAKLMILVLRSTHRPKSSAPG